MHGLCLGRTKCSGVRPDASPKLLMSLFVSSLNLAAASLTASALLVVTASITAETASAAPMILLSVCLVFASLELIVVSV